MAIFWRYLLREFLKVFTFSVTALIALLLITRLQEIAHFATLSTSLRLTALFILCQIPYILPFAIPLSSLVASMLLFQKLSASHELTALRSAGLSLKEIKWPLKLFALILSLSTFLIASELTPITRHIGKQMLETLALGNPLLLLEKNKQLKVKNSFVDMKMLEVGKEVQDLTLVLKYQSNLSLIMVKSLKVDQGKLVGHQLSYITTTPPANEGELGHLIIENNKTMEAEAQSISAYLMPKSYGDGVEHFPLKPLIEAILWDPELTGKALAKAKYELIRRFFFPLITLTFTLLGMSYGSQIGRNRSLKALKTLGLASYALICFLASKSYHKNPEVAAFLMLILPNLPLLFLAYRSERRIDRGIA